ncbi:MAG: hypothetical protein LVQ64_06670, partial [Thermoplasmatales archaeon]|nr:hypothetical protein [Thermoplasmatales archaeon]
RSSEAELTDGGAGTICHPLVRRAEPSVFTGSGQFGEVGDLPAESGQPALEPDALHPRLPKGRLEQGKAMPPLLSLFGAREHG